MASKVIAVEQTGGCVVVTIRHLNTDSFSRSVDRAANKVWRELPRDVQLRTRYVRANYAHTSFGRSCYSTVAYGPTFAAASAALPATLLPEGQHA